MWELKKFAEKNLKTNVDIAKFFYYWIGTNITYDYGFSKEMKENFGLSFHKVYEEKQHPYTVYTRRKGVCAGYARLYKWFMNELEIEVEIISGHIRDERNHFVELLDDDDFRHGWNAVKLKDKWILVDTTWGTSGNKEVSDFYFDIDPKFAIITHFPEEKRWQLLEKPLTLEEFNKSKFIKPFWFQIGFTDIPVLKEDKEYYYLVYKSNADKGWSINLMYGTDNINYNFIHDTVKIEQDGFTYVRFKKKDIPKKAFYKMDLNYSDEENKTSRYIFNVYYFKT